MSEIQGAPAGTQGGANGRYTLVVNSDGSINAVTSGGGGGAATIADGADVAQGTTTDASSANTVVGLLKNLKAALAGTLTVGGTATTTSTPASTATLANVGGSVSSVTLIALNTNRLGGMIVNDSTAVLYIKFGSTASATSYTYVLPGTGSVAAPAFLELPATPRYTGIITGIWASAAGAARTTELTA